MRLADKVIIVTGAATGVGRAIAQRCVREGAKVLVHDRHRAALAEVATALGASAAMHVDDLLDPTSAPRIVAAAIAAFGRVNGLVNNAASIVRSNLTSTDASFFDAVMAVNVRAPLLLIQAAMPHLKATGGCVLNIGSINAYSGEPNLLDYSISKGALQTLSRNLANSHAEEGVRINHVNLGWVLTPNEDALQQKYGQPPDWSRNVPKQYVPSGKMTAPEDIAAAAIYWLGDESRPINGSVVELEQYCIMGRNPAKS